jgi:CMP-N,N'-diacetyllegionaminic acid synthase
LKVLILIPARGGSKGIPGKNIKQLAGKPLIYYSLDIAKAFLNKTNVDSEICISTDDINIQKVVNDYGITTPFIRPESLSTDTSTTVDVISHALDYYKNLNIAFNYIILLQPTSPFRRLIDLLRSWNLIQENTETDAVISVFDSGANPYYNMVELNNGFIKKSKHLAEITRRQDGPKVYQLNGAIYILKVDSFLSTKSIMSMDKIKMIEMPSIHSIDIDYQSEWDYCEYLIYNKSIIPNKLLNS